MKSMKRKGFTLVELLIVIVVIGILAAMMMLSSTEAVTSAKANNITSNLRNLKTAALSFYADHQDAYSLDPNTAINGESADKIFTYLNGEKIPDSSDYSFRNFTGEWFVYYHVTSARNSATEQPKIWQKLKGRARSLGLFWADGQGGSPSSQSLADGGDTAKEYVAMQIR